VRIIVSQQPELAGPRHRQHSQHHRVNEAEDRRVSADAQGQRQDRNDREAGASLKLTQAIANVLPH
jgi:hypothetical protein